MKIVFDLDGVLRDLMAYLEVTHGVPMPDTWFWRHAGRDIYEWVEHDKFKILTDAPATEYLAAAKEHVDKFEIWTCQPEEWRPYTEQWIARNIGDATIRYLANQEKRERLDFLTDTILIEDSPQFSHYDRVVLLDRPYNRAVHCPYRFNNVDHLIELLEFFAHGNARQEV